jgi:beta-glucosidase-like glycosyl hydrolase
MIMTRRDFAQISGAVALGLVLPGRAVCAQGTPPAALRTPMQRAEELLRQMTVEEKAMQLSSVFPLALFDTAGTNRRQLDALLKHGIGHVSALGLIGHKTPEALAQAVNAIQRYLVTETRLKIPAIFHNEAMSGVVAPHFTAFPTLIGLAATWDPAAVEAMADLIRRQMRAVGLLQALAPVMDVARDARWGRVSETYGEDPYLVSAMSVAYTRGLQGKDLSQGVLATAKHFLGYAVTEGGQNMAATAVGARELYDVHARPFEAAIRLAGLATVMPSYAEFDGVPVSASRAVLTDMLRDKMGFTGTTVSDYVAVGFLQSRQRVTATPEEAGALALAAGMDVETASRLRLRGGAGQGCARRQGPRVTAGPVRAACATRQICPRPVRQSVCSGGSGHDPRDRERGCRPLPAARRRIGDAAQERAGSPARQPRRREDRDHWTACRRCGGRFHDLHLSGRAEDDARAGHRW